MSRSLVKIYAQVGFTVNVDDSELDTLLDNHANWIYPLDGGHGIELRKDGFFESVEELEVMEVEPIIPPEPEPDTVSYTVDADDLSWLENAVDECDLSFHTWGCIMRAKWYDVLKHLTTDTISVSGKQYAISFSKGGGCGMGESPDTIRLTECSRTTEFVT